MWSHHYYAMVDGAFRRNSVPFRYAWPAELDLMAGSPGCGCGSVGPVGPDAVHRGSTPHVSVWEKPVG